MVLDLENEANRIGLEININKINATIALDSLLLQNLEIQLSQHEHQVDPVPILACSMLICGR